MNESILPNSVTAFGHDDKYGVLRGLIKCHNIDHIAFGRVSAKGAFFSSAVADQKAP